MTLQSTSDERHARIALIQEMEDIRIPERSAIRFLRSLGEFRESVIDTALSHAEQHLENLRNESESR